MKDPAPIDLEGMTEDEQKAYDAGWNLGQMGHIDPLDTYSQQPLLRSLFLRGMVDGLEWQKERES